MDRASIRIGGERFTRTDRYREVQKDRQVERNSSAQTGEVRFIRTDKWKEAYQDRKVERGSIRADRYRRIIRKDRWKDVPIGWIGGERFRQGRQV